MMYLISSWYTDSYFHSAIKANINTIYPNVPLRLVSSSPYYCNDSDKFSKAINFCEYLDKAEDVILKEGYELLIKRIENEYEIYSLSEMWRSDPFTVLKGIDQNIKNTLAHFLAWESIFEREPPTFLYTEVGGALIRRTAFIVAKKYNAKSYQGCFAPFPNRSFLANDEKFDPEELYSLKDDLIEEESYKQAKLLINSFRDKKTNFAKTKKPKLNSGKSNQLREYLRLHKYEKKNPQWHLDIWIKNFLLKKLRFSFQKFLIKYDQPIEGQQFVFFPLHVEIDSQVLVRAQHITDQLDLIKLISLHLPTNVYLYAKSHPSLIGGYSTDFFNRLKQMDKVKIIHPEVPAYNLIKMSKAVFVLNSTVGFEALLLKKAVITYASSYYRGKGITYDLESPFRIGEILKSALNEGFKWSEESLTEFVAKLYQVTFEGDRYFWLNSNTMALENDFKKLDLKSMSNGLAKELVRRYRAQNN